MNTKDFEDKRWSAFKQKIEFRHRAALSLLPHGEVLDIGCGDGLLLRLLREKGIAARGIDLSEAAVAICCADGLEVTAHDFTVKPLPLPDHSIEYVVALDVLEHVYDPAAILAEMARVASAAVIIGVPNFSSLPARLQVLAGRVPENNRPNKGHIYWFNWRVVSALAAKCGLHIAEMRVNAPWERMPIIDGAMHQFAEWFPNLFALSFVVRLEHIGKK